ncbi:MAG: hypothetical protein M1817_006110 [Caeruleum heppii]|nr:MAG: hypothetical protein M1817_006110 [Caeruleum heppii]
MSSSSPRWVSFGLCLLFGLRLVLGDSDISQPSSSSTRLMSPRKTLARRDFQITCHVGLPQPNPESGRPWPEGIPAREEYFFLADLCAATSNLANAGCYCNNPGNTMHCRAMFANWIIWRTPWMRHHCQNFCSCEDPSDRESDTTGAGGWRYIDGETVSSNTYSSDYNSDDTSLDSGDTATSGQSRDSEGSADVPGAIQAAKDVKLPKKAPVVNPPPVNPPPVNPPPVNPAKGKPASVNAPSEQVGPGSCPAKCTNDNPSCGGISIMGRRCVCIFDGSKAAGNFFFLGSCSSAGSRRRRQRRRRTVERWGCACNASYVSAQCCDLEGEEGIVWEPPDKKLGRLGVSG